MPKCCYCGDETNLHLYGSVGADFSKDFTRKEEIYACSACDPTVDLDALAALIGVKWDSHSVTVPR